VSWDEVKRACEERGARHAKQSAHARTQQNKPALRSAIGSAGEGAKLEKVRGVTMQLSVLRRMDREDYTTRAARLSPSATTRRLSAFCGAFAYARAGKQVRLANRHAAREESIESFELEHENSSVLPP